MICRANYDSFDEIPKKFRDEFEQNNGKWALKESAVPGAGALFNPGLAANKSRMKDQLQAKKDEVEKLSKKVTELEAKVDSDPGSIQLSPADAELWTRYQKIGTPKEVEQMATEHEEFSSKITEIDNQKEVAKFATDTGLNSEVLNDWKISDDSIEFFTKKDGEDTVGYVKVTKEKDGKSEVTEHKVLEYAEQNLVAYKYNALTQVDNSSQVVNTNGKKSIGNTQQKSFVKQSGATKTSGQNSDTTAKTPGQTFQEQRDKAPNPFASSDS